MAKTLTKNNPARKALTNAVNKAIAAGSPIITEQRAPKVMTAKETRAAVKTCKFCGHAYLEPCSDNLDAKACSNVKLNERPAQKAKEAPKQVRTESAHRVKINLPTKKTGRR